MVFSNSGSPSTASAKTSHGISSSVVVISVDLAGISSSSLEDSGDELEGDEERLASNAANSGKRISVDTSELEEKLCGFGWASKNSAISERTRLSIK
ncbi:unnamed protein product [Rodentolepis nana]|uniref:Suppressor protein SRP40-like n=1 Tax=Rodentolepis nana TaxID=102285 RepID=A0A0R3T7W8_RODNA|nr:unnamed protein product [Rodentolepis nana]